ncbi:MAG: tRNA threonylcarbamoyladenosine dehydratase [Epulopiscium sp.]|nr:tRNA threonylcarbamoyladenosine dehydratase [Candidatus Epulonipiscium sp.]
METIFSRTELLLGQKAMEKLYKSKVAIFGIGGVGSFVAEGLVRSGIGEFVLVDHDRIDSTNINRQIHATTVTIGQPKVEVMKERMLQIHPEVKIQTYQTFFLPEQDEIPWEDWDYVVDAIDTVSGKIALVERAKKEQIPIISCLGAGNKLDPTRLEVGDIYETSICPLAKVMRRELKKRNISSLKVVYSKEPPLKPLISDESTKIKQGKRPAPGSVSFVPSVAGLIIAGEVIKDLIKGDDL